MVLCLSVVVLRIISLINLVIRKYVSLYQIYGIFFGNRINEDHRRDRLSHVTAYERIKTESKD